MDKANLPKLRGQRYEFTAKKLYFLGPWPTLIPFRLHSRPDPSGRRLRHPPTPKLSPKKEFFLPLPLYHQTILTSSIHLKHLTMDKKITLNFDDKVILQAKK